MNQSLLSQCTSAQQNVRMRSLELIFTQFFFFFNWSYFLPRQFKFPCNWCWITQFFSSSFPRTLFGNHRPSWKCLPFAFLLTQELKSHWIISPQVPKIAVPLNTTKYNPSLDDNLTLISSFNKFPYPTQAELSWLTAASKHPEEQIKVWFTTQRLKQGISWSPEEVGIIVHKNI